MGGAIDAGDTNILHLRSTLEAATSAIAIARIVICSHHSLLDDLLDLRSRKRRLVAKIDVCDNIVFWKNQSKCRAQDEVHATYDLHSRAT